MVFLKTPSSQFDNLSDYPFGENYIDVADGMSMHYVDEGNKDAEVVLMLHGEPSWSYLYRKMIPSVVDAGYRAIAPDLIGFGKSDKPTEQSDYTYAKHLEWIEPIFQKFDKINLFIQDWGGLLGLRMIEKYTSKINRIIIANTFLPSGQPANEAFSKWRAFSQKTPIFPTSGVINMGTTTTLSDEVLAAYDAPYPDESYKAGARIFPMLVPTGMDNPETANNIKTWEYLKTFKKPVLTLFSDQDPIMNGFEKIFHKLVPGCNGMPHEIIENAGHFLQEDQGEVIAEKVVAFMKSY